MLKSITHVRRGVIAAADKDMLVPVYMGEKLSRVDHLKQRKGVWCLIISYQSKNIKSIEV